LGKWNVGYFPAFVWNVGHTVYRQFVEGYGSNFVHTESEFTKVSGLQLSGGWPTSQSTIKDGVAQVSTLRPGISEPLPAADYSPKTP
jgi:hypothetical protein